MRNETVALREEIVRSSMFEEIVGSSESLRKVLAQVSRVAPTDSTVLIQGETGTGKELIARAIHNRSKRVNRAFIRVNCTAIPAFADCFRTIRTRKRFFQPEHCRDAWGASNQADGGNDFSWMRLVKSHQRRKFALLRVLQEREFERVGGNQTVRVDVRVLSATNKDLRAAVADGTFPSGFVSTA